MPKRINILWFLPAGILIFLIIAKAEAQHECQGGHNCNDGGGSDITNTSVDASSTTSFRSKSYGIGGADYDIGQCMYHVGGLTIAIGMRNKFCEGMDMIRMGMIDAGTLHICKQTKIGDNYGSLEDCQTGLAVVFHVEPEPVIEDIRHDAERHDSEVRALQVQLASFVAEQKKANQRAARYASQQRQAQAVEDARTEQLLVDLRKISNE